MSSEVVLGALAVSGATDVWLLLAVATAGNTLGAVVNWGIGLYASTWRTRLHWPQEAKFERACRWFNRWGIWCLLLSWLPVAGDPLTLGGRCAAHCSRPLCATRGCLAKLLRPTDRDLSVGGILGRTPALANSVPRSISIKA